MAGGRHALPFIAFIRDEGVSEQAWLNHMEHAFHPFHHFHLPSIMTDDDDDEDDGRDANTFRRRSLGWFPVVRIMRYFIHLFALRFFQKFQLRYHHLRRRDQTRPNCMLPFEGCLQTMPDVFECEGHGGNFSANLSTEFVGGRGIS